MSIFTDRRIVFTLKFYVCTVLVITAIVSNPVTSAVAVFALLIYLYLQWRPINITANLIGTYFAFFAIAILPAPVTNFVISTLISLPVLFLVTNSLINTAALVPRRITKYLRNMTQIGMTLPFIAVINLIVALFLGNGALALSSAVSLIYLAILITLSIAKISSHSLLAENIEERMVAGTTSEMQVILHSKTKIGGILFMESPYEWLKIHSPVMLLKKDPMTLRLSLSPRLSGPSEIRVNAFVMDSWGLTQTQFQLPVLRLHVIPRAHYAAWLAKRYLEATKPGILPLISNVATVRPQYGFRRGIEYYGSQLYQPGDDLKNIDWKHSAKYSKMITKEFIEFHGQPAVLLINLVVANAEEADEVAQTTILAAISLARQQIPTVIAAYDLACLRLVTQTLQPRQIVVQSLEITNEITIISNPTRYLHNPDITRLRTNIGRLNAVAGESAKVLSQLMGVEYASCLNSTTSNPATEAINKALKNARNQSTIVIVSKLNHDANAIEINRFLMTKRGYAFVAV